MSQECVVIVDPFSSGAKLAEELRSRGVGCVAVESSSTIPASMKSGFDPTGFLEVIEAQGEEAAVVNHLRRFEPRAVLAGFESGVELAERLAERLELPCNDPRFRSTRRDKFAMTQRVAAQGLRVPRSFQSRDLPAILEWVHRHNEWPVIVKPLRSVASDHVFRCHGDAELERAVSAILACCNVLGEPNESVLVQEYLDGTEYAVDVVCLGKARVITAIWQYDRPAEENDRLIGYDAMWLLPYEGDFQRTLVRFVEGVLEALGIRYGPAHCEVMCVDGTPVLVEVGARLSAGINAELSSICGGIGQLEKTVQLILEPQDFVRTASVRPVLDRFAVNVFVMPPHPGRLRCVRGVEELKRLPTLHSMSVASEPGVEVGRVAGIVTLVSDDRAALRRDVDRVRELQSHGIFEVEPQ